MKNIDIGRHKILAFEYYKVVYLENTKAFTKNLEWREIMVYWPD